VEYSQEERDELFVQLFGNWDNPVLHLSSEELARIEQENKWWEAISKARHFAKKDHIIVDEYVRKKVSGISKTLSGEILRWENHSATGAVYRDMNNIPYVQIMENTSFELIWLNMVLFDGFIGQQYFEYGKKKDWLTGQ